MLALQSVKNTKSKTTDLAELMLMALQPADVGGNSLRRVRRQGRPSTAAVDRCWPHHCPPSAVDNRGRRRPRGRCRRCGCHSHAQHVVDDGGGTLLLAVGVHWKQRASSASLKAAAVRRVAC